jgi:hypothetical protein
MHESQTALSLGENGKVINAKPINGSVMVVDAKPPKPHVNDRRYRRA